MNCVPSYVSELNDYGAVLLVPVCPIPTFYQILYQNANYHFTSRVRVIWEAQTITAPKERFQAF